MAGNISAGDFGSCGVWYKGCAIDQGCIYGMFADTEEKQTEMLLYAMNHCAIFHKIYIDPDHNQEFIKKWKESVKNISKPKRIIEHIETTKSDETIAAVLKEAEELIYKSLGVF